KGELVTADTIYELALNSARGWQVINGEHTCLNCVELFNTMAAITAGLMWAECSDCGATTDTCSEWADPDRCASCSRTKPAPFA
ncbi:MAG: hypothetical protein KKB93_14330, partial [Actinobacteria bacterium]|nr:hypothetical protein [Actinomycetota bacterium]